MRWAGANPTRLLPVLVKQLVVDLPVPLHRHVIFIEHRRLDHSVGDPPDITTEKLKGGKRELRAMGRGRCGRCGRSGAGVVVGVVGAVGMVGFGREGYGG